MGLDVNKLSITTLATAALGLCVCCNSGEAKEATTAPVMEAPEAQAEAPLAVEPAAAPALAAATGSIRGTVAETMDSGGYTYVLVDTGSEQVWAAGPEIAVAVGATVSFDGSMTMEDYNSPTLGRTFDKVYFTGAIEVDGVTSSPHAAAAAPATTTAPALGTEGIAKADDGVTVSEVFTERDDLVGTEIVLRAKVVKYSAQIMGKNWMHLQDGSGEEGTNDLTITTDATAEVGDIVLVRGVLAADRDFGYGYLYDLIIEDAQITVE